MVRMKTFPSFCCCLIFISIYWEICVAFLGTTVTLRIKGLYIPSSLTLNVSASTSTDAPSNGLTGSSFLIHKGRSAEMIRRSPALSGVTLAKGWSQSATKAFISAVHSVVEQNPILTGHVYNKHKDCFSSSGGEIWIDSGTFTPDNHEFVKQIKPPPDSPDFSTMNATETLSYCVNVLMPLFEGSELTEKQIQLKLPLFATNIILLPDNYAFYSVKLSHAVGDGVTFFQILKEISMHMHRFHHNDNISTTTTISTTHTNIISKSTLDWNNPLKATHEFFPDSFSPWDVEVSYGAPFLCGLLKNFPTLPCRKQNILLLCKHKIQAKKQQLRTAVLSNDSEPNISSNDIITAALCEANESSDIFVFTKNVRGIKDGIPRNASGNFFSEIPIPRLTCADPIRCRESVLSADRYYNETNKLPIQPFLCGKVGRLTSLATITEKIIFYGTDVVCQMPFLSFIQDIPLDVAVIFRFSDSYWGVLHNFARFHISKSGLLSEIISDN